MGYACKLSGLNLHNKSITLNSNSQVDLGALHSYRYVTEKAHSTTLTLTQSGSTDMGTHHEYRYVNATLKVANTNKTLSSPTSTATVSCRVGDLVYMTMMSYSTYTISCTNATQLVNYTPSNNYCQAGIYIGRATSTSCKFTSKTTNVNGWAIGSYGRIYIG